MRQDKNSMSAVDIVLWNLPPSSFEKYKNCCLKIHTFIQTLLVELGMYWLSLSSKVAAADDADDDDDDDDVIYLWLLTLLSIYFSS